MKKTATKFWVSVGVIAVAIHTIFCVQAYASLQQGGMVSAGSWLSVFYPQYLLDFFLPPPYPISYTATGAIQVDYFDFWGKMAVAFPASVVYALFVAGIGAVTIRLYKRVVHGHAA